MMLERIIEAMLHCVNIEMIKKHDGLLRFYLIVFNIFFNYLHFCCTAAKIKR